MMSEYDEDYYYDDRNLEDDEFYDEFEFDEDEDEDEDDDEHSMNLELM